jgi:hypothetical protein
VPQLKRIRPYLSCFYENNGSAPSKNRTCDLGFRKALLYPTELRGRTGICAAEAVTFAAGAQVFLGAGAGAARVRRVSMRG